MEVILAIAKKYYLEFFRNKISIVLLLIFPLFFLFIFNMAFGGADIGELTTYNVTIVNNDEGFPPQIIPALTGELTNWAENGVGANLTSVFSDLTYNDTQATPIFNFIDISQENITSAITEGEILLAIVIPEDYSMMVLNQVNNVYGNQSIPGYPTTTNASIEFIRDETNIISEIPMAISKEIIQSFHQVINSGRIPQILEIQSNSIVKGELTSIFDFIASGILVFASIISSSFFSALLLNDQEFGTIRRIKVSMTKPYEYILGFLLMSFTLILVQNVILIYSAVYIFGYNPQGSILRGYLILILSSLPMYALVFSAGAVFKSSDTAGNAIGFSSSILGFASNAFIEMPHLVLIPGILDFRSGAADLLVWDLVPWTHAVNAMRTVMQFDRTLADVAGDLILLIIFSLIWLILGLNFYMRRTFRLED